MLENEQRERWLLSGRTDQGEVEKRKLKKREEEKRVKERVV